MEVIPVRLGEVSAGSDIAEMVLSAARVSDGDILVVSHKIVSKSEGRLISLDTVVPSMLAEGIAAQYGKDARLVELVLRESRRIVRMRRGVLITQTVHGFVCANSGVDESNVRPGHAVLLPEDPDMSARRISKGIEKRTGRRVAVLVSDTFGRPFRLGQTDCAIGVHGISPIVDYRGTLDLHGRELRVSEIAVADELCAAAELVKRKHSCTPVAIIRGLALAGSGTSSDLLRPKDEDLFA